ncbi:cytochrome c biogenesis protein CcdA [Methyloceanibacter sp.]|uniref:cytochrome c biogenesis protein CcdA n=1 Tax=Methyloceanibacter sp. TaxID=1965321 RepID=UPI002BA5A251|nr:cytochrome c biogenesis protein CcdA [Methyloceanibacter sp.]HML92965.1 cytochrome c biogenesis protein CcdA [Methyloceanibacter sp.]
MDLTVTGLVALPLGLGLLGFIEPCAIGSTLLFVKYLEGKDQVKKLAEVSIFAATRALFIGLLGVAAVLVGSAFFGFQRGAWIFLGAAYLLLGIAFVAGMQERLLVTLGPRLASVSENGGSAALGLLFGLNIPACAAPLLFALLGAAAAGGATGATLTSGFIALALFGLGLSLPLIAAVLFKPARRVLDWLAGLSQQMPLWTGLLFIVLGIWSIWFGVFVDLKA